MNEKLFQDLAKSLKQAAAISKGKAKAAVSFSGKESRQLAVKGSAGVVVAQAAKPGMPISRHARIDAKRVRELTGLSQSDFALVMNVSVKTLQNWEQHRREPTGPAASLLKIVSQAPDLALKALHT